MSLSKDQQMDILTKRFTKAATGFPLDVIFSVAVGVAVTAARHQGIEPNGILDRIKFALRIEEAGAV